MSGLRPSVIFFIFVIAVGCVKAQPDFDTLNSEKLPRPLFQGSTSRTIDKYNFNETILITGECSAKITELLIRAPGDPALEFKKLESVVIGASVSCSTPCQADGKGCFSFELASLKTLNKGIDPTPGQVFEFEVKGVTDGGVSGASTLRLFYTLGPGNNRILLSSGAIRSTSAQLKADVRVTHKMLEVGATDQYLESHGPNPIKAKIGIAVTSD